MFEFFGKYSLSCQDLHEKINSTIEDFPLVLANSLQESLLLKGQFTAKKKRRRRRKTRFLLPPVVRFIHLFVLLFEWPGFGPACLRSNMMELDGTRLVAQSAQKKYISEIMSGLFQHSTGLFVSSFTQET